MRLGYRKLKTGDAESAQYTLRKKKASLRNCVSNQCSSVAGLNSKAHIKMCISL